MRSRSPLSASSPPSPARLAARPRRAPRGAAGFTLLELLVVVTMLGILATLALPSLVQMPVRAKESVLRTNLHTLRKVLDNYYGDNGYYPASLEVLAEEGYLRDVPFDPMTGSNEWGTVYEDPVDEDLGDIEALPGESEPGVIDVYSLSEDLALDGTPYSEW